MTFLKRLVKVRSIFKNVINNYMLEVNLVF